MGILKALPGVVVSIVVNGSALHEYEDTDTEDTPNALTRYVEATSNADFEVHVLAPPNVQLEGDILAFHVSADGMEMSCEMFERRGSLLRRGKTKVVKGRRDREGMLEKFRFNELQTDEHSASQDVPMLKELGTIKVEFHHKWKGGMAPRRENTKPAGSHVAVTSVSEKATKGQAISHSVGLSAPVQDYKSRSWSTFYVDASKIPCATFEFRYCSRDALRSMLLIPRTPSPESEAAPATLEDRKVITLKDDDPLELHSRAKEATEERDQKIRQDPRPRSPKRRKTRRSDGITTIELDNDGEVLRETTVFTTPDADSAIELDD